MNNLTHYVNGCHPSRVSASTASTSDDLDEVDCGACLNITKGKMIPTAHDKAHFAETIKGLREPDETFDCCESGGCDCHISETIMTSFGYAEAYRDGEVISGGRVVWREEA